jgi:hypothetical protein
MKIFQTLLTWISDLWTRKNKDPTIEIGDFWQRPPFIGVSHPYRIDGITKLWGRVIYVSMSSHIEIIPRKVFLRRYIFMNKTEHRKRLVLNTGEIKSARIPIFSGMPTAQDVVLKTIAQFTLMVLVFASAVLLILALRNLLMLLMK